MFENKGDNIMNMF